MQGFHIWTESYQCTSAHVFHKMCLKNLTFQPLGKEVLGHQTCMHQDEYYKVTKTTLSIFSHSDLLHKYWSNLILVQYWAWWESLPFKDQTNGVAIKFFVYDKEAITLMSGEIVQEVCQWEWRYLATEKGFKK